MAMSITEQIERDRRTLLGDLDPSAALESVEPLPPVEPLPGEQPPEDFLGPASNFDRRTEFEKGVDQFNDNITAIALGIGATAAGIAGAEDKATQLARRSKKNFDRASVIGPDVTSLAQVHNPSDAFKFVQGVFGSQVPQFGVTLGAAAVGTVVGTAVGTPALGAAVGGFIAGAGLETGSDAAELILDPKAKGTVQERAAINAVSGVIRGSLEAFPALRLLKHMKGLQGVNVEKEILKRMPRQLVEQFFKQGSKEAVTEAAQEAISIATHRFVNDNIELFSDENLLRLADSAAGGFFVGGAAGSILGTKKRATPRLKEETERLQARLDAHLSGEKSLVTQIEEEAAGVDSMSGVEALERDRDPIDVDAQFQENVTQERESARERLEAAGQEALKRAAKAKGINVETLTNAAKRFAAVAEAVSAKIDTLKEEQLASLRSADPNSFRGKAFNFAEAKYNRWVEFAEKYPAVVRLGSGIAFLAGFAADAPQTDSRSRVDKLMTELAALGARSKEAGLTDTQKAVIRARGERIISKIKGDKDMLDQLAFVAAAQSRDTGQVTPELAEFIQGKVAQGTPIETLAEKLGLSVVDIANATPADERFLMNSRSVYTSEQLADMETQLDDDIQALGGDELKVAAMQHRFEQLSEDELRNILQADIDSELADEARSLESAAALYGLTIDGVEAAPEPMYDADGLPLVTLRREATNRPDEPTSAERAVREYNAGDGIKANRRRRLRNFAEYVGEVLNTPARDRSPEELALFGTAKSLDDTVQVNEKTTSLKQHLRRKLELKLNNLAAYQIRIEEVLNPEIISGVPYLLTQKDLAQVYAGKEDITLIPVAPHNSILINGRSINLPRLVERARTALLTRSPSFFKDVLQDAEGKPVGALDRALLSLHHGIADLIVRGVIDTWPILPKTQVIDFMRVKGQQVPITWEMVQGTGIAQRLEAMARGLPRYLMRRFEGTLLKNTRVLRDENNTYSSQALNKAKKWFSDFGIDPGSVKISPSGERIANITDYMDILQKYTMLGVREEYIALREAAGKSTKGADFERGLLKYYQHAAKNKTTLITIAQQFKIEGTVAKEAASKALRNDAVRNHARALIRMTDRSHRQRVADFKKLADLKAQANEIDASIKQLEASAALDRTDESAAALKKMRKKFFALVEEMKESMGLPKGTGPGAVLQATNAQLLEYFYNYLSNKDRTSLEEIIGVLNISNANLDRDVLAGDVPRFGSRFEVEADIDAGFINDVPTNIEQQTYTHVPTLHTPIEFFNNKEANLLDFSAELRQEIQARGKYNPNAPLPLWVKALWDKHMRGFEADESKIKQRFAEDFARAKVLMEEINVATFEHELYRLIMKRTSRWVFPNSIGSWAEMKAAAPRTPEARKLIRQREEIVRDDKLREWTVEDALLIHHVFLRVDPGASLNQRLAAIHRIGAPHEQDFLDYRDYIVSELARTVPILRWPKNRTIRNMFVSKDPSKTVMQHYDTVMRRISESIPGVTTSDEVLSSLVDTTDLMVKTFSDLSDYIMSVRLQTAIQQAQILEKYAQSAKAENSRDTQYSVDLNDNKIVEEATISNSDSVAAHNRVAKDDMKGNPAQAPRTTHTTHGDIFHDVRRFIENISTASFQPYHVDVAAGQTGIPGPNGQQHAGWYDPVLNVIRVASNLSSEWIMGVGAHEALHSIFTTMLYPGELRALSRSMNQPVVVLKILKFFRQSGADAETMRKIQAAIDPDMNPNGYLEERAAYAFQAYAMSRSTANPFKIAKTPTTLFEKLIVSLKHIFRYMSSHEQADTLFEFIITGELKQASLENRRVSLRKQGQWMLPEQVINVAHNAYIAMGHWNRAFVTPMDIAMRRTKNPALIALADLIYRSPLYTSKNNNQPTFLSEFQRQRIGWTDRFQKKWETMSPQRRAAVRKNLYARTDPESLDGFAAQDLVWFRTFFAGIRGYAITRGADLGDIDAFVPIVWDPQQVANNEAELRAILARKDPEMIESFGGVDRIIENLKTAGDVWDDMQQIGLDHRESSAKPRKYKFFNDEDLGNFMRPDFEMTMQSYIKQITRHAEYQHFLGKDGSIARELVRKAIRLGATPMEAQDAVKYVLAARGVLGSNMSERLTRITSWAVTYQHVRVLAFATFSSFVEMQGIAVRSQSVAATWAAYKAAFEQVKNLYVDKGRRIEIRKRIKELAAKPTLRPEEEAEFEALVKERQDMRTDNVRFAESMGTLDAAIMYDELLSSTGARGLTTTTARINKVFFRWIGLEAWTNLTRTMATRAAYVFIKENVMKPRKHSNRFLLELGLKPSNIVFDADGEIIHTVEGLMANDVNLTLEEAQNQAEQFRRAIWKFVDESVMRPNAAQRPLNASDPHWIMLFHLKQYIFSVQSQILNRVLKEAIVHKNGLPLANLASFVPVMLAADYMRSSIQYAFNDDDTSPFEKYDIDTLLWRSVRRSGILGMVELFTSFGENVSRHGGTGIESLIGPAPQQALELARTLLTGTPSAWKAFVNALPVNNVFRNWGVPIY